MAQALKQIDELQARADTDFLLDILNRRGFERELHRSIAYIKRYHASGGLIVLDVDRLKPINDAFGHAAGDEVLKEIVAVLRRHVRTSDVIGRLGGDEFAVLLWNLSETDAHAKAAALEQAVDRLAFMFRGRSVTAGASAGVAVLGPHAEAGKALEEADRAMYVRKAQRRHESAAQYLFRHSVRRRGSRSMALDPPRFASGPGWRVSFSRTGSSSFIIRTAQTKGRLDHPARRQIFSAVARRRIRQSGDRRCG